MEKYTILPKNNILIRKISFFWFSGKIVIFSKKNSGRIIHIKKSGKDLFKSLHFIHLYTHCTSFCFWCCFPYFSLWWCILALIGRHFAPKLPIWDSVCGISRLIWAIFSTYFFNTVFLSNPYYFLLFFVLFRPYPV